MKPRRTRRPRGSLTRDQVVGAALALADEDGVESMSMPNLARRLDCGVMTIYGYVDSKEELLDAIAQAGLRDLRLPHSIPSEPGAILTAWGRALRDTLLRHPSLPMIFLSRAVVGPGILIGVETLLARLHEAGMPPSSGVHAIYAVLIYATGFAAWEVPRTTRQRQEQYAASFRREFASLPPGGLPHVGSVIDELGRIAGEEQFELGLNALVAGLTPALPSSASGGTAALRNPSVRRRKQ